MEVVAIICLDNTDVIEGGANVDAVIDYQIHGLVGTTFTQLAAGVMGTTLTTVLYTAGAAISVVSIILVNKSIWNSANVTLCLDPANGGNPRYLIPRTVSLGIGYSLHTDGARITVMDASGNIVTSCVANAVNIGTSIHGVANKATPVNADKVPSIDTEDSNTLKTSTWTNIKAFLKTYFDGLYGDVSAGANIDSNVPAVGDDGAKGIKKYVTNILNLVQTSRSQFTYSDADQITCGAAQYVCKDKYCYWTSTITTVATGAAGGADWWYLYLDYSAITSGTALTASELVWSTTEPTWNTTYRRWMNGDDRCIFAVRTDGSNNILEFFHGSDLCIFAQEIENLAGGDLDDVWTDVTLMIPKFSTKAKTIMFSSYVDGGAILRWRTFGQSDTSGHAIIYSGVGLTYPFDTIDVIANSSQKIQVKHDVSNGNTAKVCTDGWYFPIGM